MQHPIKISQIHIGTDTTEAVNARELHKSIDAKRQFANWIQDRIKKYGFEENRDYIVVTEQTHGRPLKEYYITLDMAKELAMVENNEKGRQIRLYFIEVEKRMRQQAPAGCPAERFDSRINGYKSQIAQKNKKIEDLRWELAAAKTKLQELENRKIADGDWILAEHNLLDLVGALSRHKEELDAYGQLLETIALEHKKRMAFVEHLLNNIVKYHPKTRNVAETAKTHARKWLQDVKRIIQ